MFTHEQRHSMQIKQIIDSLALEDVWQHDRKTHTWRQSGSRKSSRLDRIYYQHNLIMTECQVDWTFTNSDHAAVIASFSSSENNKKQKILRLNPELLQHKDAKEAFLKEYQAQIQQIPPTWDPHTCLEFHKCAIRSAYISVNKERRKTEKLEYEFIQEDLHSHIRCLEETRNDAAKANRLRSKINQLKAKITKLNLERGTNLANKLKTK